MSTPAVPTAPLVNPFNPLGPNPGPVINIYGVNYQTSQLATDAIYLASKPPLIQANWANMKANVPNTAAGDAALQLVNALAGEGYLIDPAVDFEGFDFFITMAQRIGAGLSEVPDWTGSRSIKVSIMASDYPPAVAPAPAPIPPAQQLVGALLPAQTAAAGKNVYGPGNVSVYNVTNGEPAVAPDGTPVMAVVTMGLMGASLTWMATGPTP